MIFEWDEAKAALNLAKHAVSFEEATSVFSSPLAATFFDAAHSTVEDRFITVGMDSRGRLLYVVHTDADDVIRLISARVATAHERTRYEQHC